MTEFTYARTSIYGLSRKSALQVGVVAAVAVAGISFGRWVIPADTSSGGSGVAPSTTTMSAHEIIAQRSVDLGKLDRVVLTDDVGTLAASVAAIDGPSAAEIIARRSVELGKLDRVPFIDDVGRVAASAAALDGPSAAEIIAQRKFESGRLDQVLFGTG